MLRIYNLTRSLNQKSGYQKLSHLFDNINNSITVQSLTCFRKISSGNEEYISEVIKNFNKFSDNGKEKKARKLETDLASNESDDTILADVVVKRYQRKRISNFKKYIETKNINIDDSSQKSIDTLLKEEKTSEARDMILTNIKNNTIPNFGSLRKISSWLAKQGDSHNLRIIQDTARSNYKLSFENENGFDHYLCEAIFREGDHKNSFILLTFLLDNSKFFKKVKETACFLMRMVPNISEENQKEAFEIAKKFISRKNSHKPAVVLWITAFKSNQYNLHYHGGKLWQEFPNLLEGEEDYLTHILKEATSDNNYELLHRMMEVVLKLDNKELLQNVLSSLLDVYCSMENVPKAKEAVKFALEENIYIPAEVLQNVMNLQKKKKHLASLLAQSLGFNKVVKESEETCTSSKYKF